MSCLGRKKNTTTSSSTAATTSKTKSENVDAGSASQTHKTQTMTLEKRIEFHEKKAQANLVEAKGHLQAKNKRGVVQALKRKKFHERQIESLRFAVYNLQVQAFAIENASVTTGIIICKKGGKAAVESTQVNLDDVEDLEDELTQQQEIDDILMEHLGDDNERLAELDELDDLDEQEEWADLDSEFGSVSVREPAPSLDLPNAPAGAIPAPSRSKAKEDTEALTALEADMKW